VNTLLTVPSNSAPPEVHSCWLLGRRVTLHSQPETQQDEWVLSIFGQKERGTFIEVGAYDGVYHSNTLCLERDFGWTGWLIEALQPHAHAAKRVRRAPVITEVLGPDECDRDLYVGGQWSGLKDFTRKNLVDGHHIYHNPTIQVRTITLSRLLRSLRVPQVINYLSLDVEGAEYPILKSYFQDPPAQFRCMTIEIGSNADHINELCALLEPQGYRLDNIRAWESYWINTRC
jgi:FkbM family methyltransferase